MGIPHRHEWKTDWSKDGCLYGMRVCDCGETFMHRKRRPKAVEDKPWVCTWHVSVKCAQHSRPRKTA